MNQIKIRFLFCFVVVGLLMSSPVFADLSDDTNNLKSQWSGACAQSGGNAPGCGGGDSDTTSTSSQPAAPAPAPAPVPSAMDQLGMAAAQQVGYSIGQSIAQAMMGPSPQQIAAQQEQQREIAAQRAYAAQQAAIAEEQRQEELARQQQATHDRLVSEMKSDDGTSYGIQGLPGIYLNNSGGPSGQQGLPLMKDDDSASTANAQVTSNTSNTTEDDGGVPLMKDDDNAPSAPPDNSSTAQEQPAEQNIPLMKDDDNNPASDNSAGQKAMDMSGVPATKAQLQALQEGGEGPDFDGRKTGNKSDTSVVDLRDAHTTTVDPSVVNGSSPSLSTINPSPADQALMRHQWEMSIDPRYLSDPAVQQNIRDLWAAARSGDTDADDKLKTVISDQFKANGMTPGQIQDFFSKFNDIFDGEFPAPKEWSNKSVTANMLDLGSSLKPDAPTLLWEKSAPYYTDKETVPALDPLESIKSNVNYMATSKQTEDDCVLYAIANGSGVDEEKVRDVFKTTVNNLGMEEIGNRSNPDNMLKISQQGGGGGVGPVEELLVAEKFGKVVPVPKDSFAKAIANTGQPVITTVNLNPPRGEEHKVVVTGVYENKDGQYYYSVMDSNLYDGKKNTSSTAYVEKSFFDEHLTSGGFVVMPNDKQ